MLLQEEASVSVWQWDKKGREGGHGRGSAGGCGRALCSWVDEEETAHEDSKVGLRSKKVPCSFCYSTLTAYDRDWSGRGRLSGGVQVWLISVPPWSPEREVDKPGRRLRDDPAPASESPRLRLSVV